MKFNKMKLAALAMSALMAASTVSPAVYAADLFSDGTAPAEEVFISEEPEVIAQEAPAVEEVPVAEEIAPVAEEILTAADDVKRVKTSSIEVYYGSEKFDYEGMPNADTVTVYYNLEGEDNVPGTKPLNHVEGKVEVKKPQTCDDKDAGVFVVFTPTGLNEIRFLFYEFPKEKHDWVLDETKDPVVVEKATHNTNGVMQYYYKCSKCGISQLGGEDGTLSEPIPASHDYEDQSRYLTTINGNVKKKSTPIVKWNVDGKGAQDLYELILDDKGNPIIENHTKDAVYYEAWFCKKWKDEIDNSGAFKGEGNEKSILLAQYIIPSDTSEWFTISPKKDANGKDISNIHWANVGGDYQTGVNTGETIWYMMRVGKLEPKKVPLENCDQDGYFTLTLYKTRDDMLAQTGGRALDYTIPSHCYEKELAQFNTASDAKLCDVTTDANGQLVVTNKSCKDISYTIVTYCDNTWGICKRTREKLNNTYDLCGCSDHNVLESDGTTVKKNVKQYRKISGRTATASGSEKYHMIDVIEKLNEWEKTGRKGIDSNEKDILVQLTDITNEINSITDTKVKDFVKVPETSEYLTATCTEPGFATVLYTCRYCGKVVKTQKIKIDKLGHTSMGYVEENYQQPTCEKDGSVDYVSRCKRCDYIIDSYTRKLKKLQHTNDPLTQQNEPGRYVVKHVVELTGDVVVNKKKAEGSPTVVPVSGGYSLPNGYPGINGYSVKGVMYSTCADCGGNKLDAKDVKVTVDSITKNSSADYCRVGTITVTAKPILTNQAAEVKDTINGKDVSIASVTKSFNYFETLDDYRALEAHDWITASETIVKEATAKEAGYKTVVSTCTRCGYSKTETVEIPALGLPAIAGLDITVAEKAVYTGEAVKAAVVVKSEDKTLVEGTDYDLAYSNNVECGKEAVVTITGKGDYQGTVTRTFEIDPVEPVVTSAKSTGYNSVKVTWNAAAGAKSYRLYYRGGSATGWTLVRKGINGTEFSYASSNLVSGVTYRYTVVAVNGSVKSTFSAKGKCAAIKPAAPVASVTFSGKKAVLTWKKVAGANGYIIQSKAPNGQWTRVGTVKSGTKVTWTDKKAVSGASYRVRAYRTVENVNVYGPFSAAAN